MKTIIAILLSAWAFCACNSPAPTPADKPESPAAEKVEPLSDHLTFWDDVAPIVFENCTPCHHADGAAPFQLTGFMDFKKRTKTIRLVIADHIMPPWPADPNYSNFKNEKTLEERQRQTILAWIDQGAVAGTENTALQPKLSPTRSLAKPDKVISFPEPIQIPGENLDVFQLAKLPFELEKDTVVRAIYFVPGNRQLVHHVNGHLINYSTGKKTDPFAGVWRFDAEQKESLDAYGEMKLYHDDGSYPAMLVSAFNYLPGVEPVAYPGNLGNVILKKKGAFILNTLHYGPSAKDTFDLSEIHLYYGESRPERPMRELHMGTYGVSDIVPEFVIPADSVCAFETRYKLDADISILTINPHMHLLGQEFTAFAASADRQDTIPLIHIPKWDFRWQYFYTYPSMLKIPKGYEICVQATFDNTTANPNNPFFPPKTLKETGEHMKTTDEMFQFFITYVPYKEGDEFINL